MTPMVTQSDETRSDLNFLTVPEIAEILRCEVRTVRRKLNEGKISGHKPGKEWRVTREQLLQYIENTSNK